MAISINFNPHIKSLMLGAQKLTRNLSGINSNGFGKYLSHKCIPLIGRHNVVFFGILHYLNLKLSVLTRRKVSGIGECSRIDSLTTAFT